MVERDGRGTIENRKTIYEEKKRQERLSVFSSNSFLLIFSFSANNRRVKLDKKICNINNHKVIKVINHDSKP